MMGNKNTKIKPKKAELESLIKIIAWIVFFGVALLALYYLFKHFGVMG